MSAFVVSHKHINALLTFASRARYGCAVYFNHALVFDLKDPAACQQAAEILLAENVRSVNHRYPDTVGHPENLPGVLAENGQAIVFRPVYPMISPLVALKACSCYDYQACETDDYPTRLAAKIIDTIRHNAISRLPGYDEAPWGLD